MLKEIPLTKGQVALVSEEDFDRINTHKWCASWSKSTRSYYAQRKTSRRFGKQRTVCMHREVMGLTFDDPEEVDHKEPSRTLDNSRTNLRMSDSSKNQMNARTNVLNTSGRKGVSPCPRTGRWMVRIMVKGKRLFLGSYGLFEEACKVREDAEATYWGEYARPV